MPPLANAKHELFAQEIAKGVTAELAYQNAGYAPSLKNAQRLKSNEGIRSRVAEILSRIAAKTEITIADIARQLDEDRDFARSCKSAAAMVAATMGKAKVLGLIVDRQAGADGGPIQTVTKVEWTTVDPPSSDREGI